MNRLLTKRKSRLGNRENVGLIYILPWIVGFLILQAYPFFASLYYSFTDYTLLKAPRFVGLDNYIRIFTIDPDFWKSMTITLAFSLIAVPAKLCFALFIAMLLNMKLRAIHFFRTVYYIPSILGGSVAVAALWKALFLKTGVVNSILQAMHLPAVDWLGSPGPALSIFVLLTSWQFGSSMVLFLAGLKGVPQDLYEAAEVDGAGKVVRFFKITLPMLSPVILFNLIMQTINMLQEFSGPFLITQGGPMKFSYFMGLKIYDEAFQFFKMGYACALSWILFLVILVLTLLSFKVSNHFVHYEDGGR